MIVPGVAAISPINIDPMSPTPNGPTKHPRAKPA